MQLIVCFSVQIEMAYNFESLNQAFEAIRIELSIVENDLRNVVQVYGIYILAA